MGYVKTFFTILAQATSTLVLQFSIGPLPTPATPKNHLNKSSNRQRDSTYHVVLQDHSTQSLL